MSLISYPSGETSFRARIIAHRGFWLEASEKNSLSAFVRALTHGFGIETDVRDLDGELVISHDPPRSRDKPMSFSTFLEIYKSIGTDGWLALNIKSDGLSNLVDDFLKKHEIENAFVFDMSVPDMRHYMNSKMNVFTRMSDIEPIACCVEQCAGVWLDSFDEPYTKSSVIDKIAAEGRLAAIVSPELHKRNHLDAWSDWASSFNLSENGRLMLCTDFPSKALEYFGDKND
ncbi:hypothetical protein GOZ97_00030 [Agrobacterium vitis]|uniref:hypothetical protein n=1 Tax=Rhizobium/Agrobacterium group TaxID=227290 RepID=UPI0008DBEC6C|nr:MULTISPECIES: hypothetical protein [Rhizobium/Agrobacterium group]MCF1436972.1 hypothetical protein [Allorhizobium ampelinum]MCF1474592.1 hypothetical protein [Allorhizobium ampelinum]MUO92558.1 hypothetical protein [Agrobacterium vitis]MUZ51987.1 hypothetical protein [Agrobacterium vitis]MUZ89796.1 hypothetical protein [Agrobacterium vitis]